MIDGKLINKYIENAKKKKPDFVVVDDEQWSEALEGYQESLSNGVDDNTTTQEFWTLIYFCAIAFCKGVEHSEVKSGLREESLYPRY